MHSAKFCLAAICILGILLSACGEKTPEAEAVCTFTDDTGTEIEIYKNPKRVAVLFSSLAEIWTLAGGDVSITVGESVERGIVPDNTLLVDAGAGKTVNTELLLSYEPDFVICSADIGAQVKTAELLQVAGISAACFKVESLTDYLRVLEICTDITGNSSAFEQNGMAVAKRVETILADIPEKSGKTVLFIRSGSSAASSKAKSSEQHFAAAMLKEIGTENIADSVPVLLDGLSTEAILEKNPDYIFISLMGSEDAAKAYMNSCLADPVWQSLDAVKCGRVYYLPRELFQYKPNANWDRAYEYLVGIVYEE